MDPMGSTPLLSRILVNQPYTPSLFNYLFRFLKIPEYNWGLSTWQYLNRENYANSYHNQEFARVRNDSDFQLLDRGWTEGRSYLYPLSSSDPKLIELVNDTLQEIQSMLPNLVQFIQIPLPINRTQGYYLLKTAIFSVGFNYSSDAIVFLQNRQRQFASINITFGVIQYKTYSIDDYNRFNLQFNPHCGPPCGDFAKPGLTNISSETVCTK